MDSRLRRLCWRVLLFGLLAQLLMLPGLARAAERRTVQAVFAGEPAVIERVVSVLRPALDHQGLVLTATRAGRIDPLDAISVTREPSPDSPVAYLWLDLAAKPVTLILIETKSSLVYAQTLRVHADPDEVETELIRFVVDQSLEAILSGSATGVTAKEFRQSLARREATAVPPQPETKPESSFEAPTPSAAHWTVAAGYSLDALGADAIFEGPEIGGQFRLPHFQVQLRVAQRLPIDLTRGATSMRLVSSAARLVAASPWALGGGFAVALGVGAGIDVTRITPAVEGALPAFWVSDPLFLSQLAVEEKWSRWLLSGYGGIEWDLVASRYAITRSRGEEAVWSPSRVRPCAGVSFGYLF